MTKQCKWCGELFPKLAKSHIIPKAFALYDGATDRRVFGQEQYPKKRPGGFWDDEILCSRCEAEFSHVDQAAAELLLQNFDKVQIPFADDRDREAVQIAGSHRHVLKRFLTYLLWRASVSQEAEFRQVSLGPYEDRIKQALISDRDFENDEYSFVAAAIKNPSGIMLPRKSTNTSFGNLRYYHIDFGIYNFDIKVDQRHSPSSVRILAEYENLVFLSMDKTPTGKRAAMVQLVRDHERWRSSCNLS